MSPSGSTPDVRAVVRALDALTTQVKRLANHTANPATFALAPPVADDRDTPTTPVACPLCPSLRFFTTPADADHHFRTKHPEQRLVGPGPWPMLATDDDATAPATTCSAQHATLDDGRECIRAAQHHGDHIDERGFHWSDTVAVYPTDSTVRIAHWHPVAEQLAEERQELAGMVGEFIDAQVRQARTADEDAQRERFRHNVRNLLDRIDRRVTLTETEAALLRHHYEAEIREADTMRSVAAGNKRHVQAMYADLQAAREETATADRIRAEAQRDRDQHAAVLTEILSRFTLVSDFTPVYHCTATIAPELFERWRSVVAPTAERPWWVDVAEAQAAIDRVRALLDTHLGPLASAAVQRALDGTEQPTTETAPKLPRLGTTEEP